MKCAKCDHEFFNPEQPVPPDCPRQLCDGCGCLLVFPSKASEDTENTKEMLKKIETDL